MWSQIVVTLIGLVIVTYVIQLFLPRSRKGQSRTSLRWDVAPMLGFFGVLLLALSLIEALRRTMIEAWGAGILLGVILGVAVWVGAQTQPPPAVQKNGSALLATFRFLRTYGIVIVVTVIGVYVAGRILGTIVEVFVSGALAILLVAIAARMFVSGMPIQEHKG